MSNNKSFYEFIVAEVFANMPEITARKMFGGYGFYRDGIFFALIEDGKMYFKVGGNNKEEYERYGSKPFQYPMKNGKMTTLSFWEVPVDILENREELPDWIEKAVEAAQIGKKK